MARAIGAWVRGLVPGRGPGRALSKASRTSAAARGPAPAPVLLYAAAAGGVLAFAAIAAAMRKPGTHAVDQRILLATRSPEDMSDPIGPAIVDEGVRDLTALGSAVVITTVTAVSSLYFLFRGNRRAAATMFVTVAGGAAVVGAVKLAFRRPEPGLVPNALLVDSTSFPSGHTMISVVTYFTLAGLLAQNRPELSTKLLLVGSAGVVSLLVGLSRIYLGVHWPTDVLGGWALGGSWTAASWAVATGLARQGGLTRRLARQ